MESSGVKRNLLFAQVARRLEDEILGGGMAIGASLPSEAGLMSRFGVSRIVVREATRALEARGLVRVSQGKRPTVIGLDASMPRDFFSMALRSDEDGLLELIEVRRTLEVRNARLAAREATEGDLRALRDAVEAMSVKNEAPLDFDRADLDFHEGLAAASGNRFLCLLIQALAEPLRASRIESRRGHSLRGLDYSDTIAAHRRILEAVVDQDPDGAARAMEEHLSEALKDLHAARSSPRASEEPQRDALDNAGSAG